MPRSTSAEVPPRPRRSILALSFGAALAAGLAIILIVAMSDSAYAVNSYSLTSTAASNNWSTANWTCTPGPCDTYPGKVAANDGVTMNLSGYIMVLDVTPNVVMMAVPGNNITINIPTGGSLTLASGSSLSNATSINVSGTGQFTTNGTFTLNSGTSVSMSSGQWSNLGTTTISGNTNFNWSGGTVISGGAGIILTSVGGPAGAINLTGAAILDNCQIQNNGNMPVSSSGALTMQNGASIINGGSITISNSGTAFSDGGGTPSFISNNGGGSLTKSAGATSTVAVQLLNGASVSAAVGTLSLTGGGTHTGSFTTAAGTTIDFAGGTHTMNSVSVSFNGPGVGLSGGTMSIAQPFSAGTFTQKGGTLSGTANFTISNFTWSGGIQGTGGGATILASGGTATLDGAIGIMTLQRTFASTISTGTINYTATTNPLTFAAGAMLQPQSGTFFNCSTDAPINGGAGLFNNVGNFRKTGGSGSTVINVPFQNLGIVSEQVSGTTIDFAAGGNNTGQMTTNTIPTATIDFSAGTFLLDVGTNINGSGAFRATGTGQVQYQTNVAADHFAITSANARLQALGAYAFTLNAAGILDFQAGTIQSGTISIPNTAQMNVGSVGATLLDAAIVNNAGSINYNSTSFFGFQNGATVNNNSGGLFLNQNDGYLKIGTGGGTIVNNSGAFFKKTGGSGASTVEPTFNNAGGTVDQQIAGTILMFKGAGSHASGNFNASGPVQWNTGANTFTLAGGTFSGTGYFELIGGTLDIQQPTAIPLFYQGAGAITGSGNLTVSTAYQWSGGSQGSSGATILNGGSTIDGLNGPMTLAGRSLTNNGTLTYTSGSTLSINAGATITNASAGTFDIQSGAAQISGPGTFQNDAAVTRTTSAAIFAIFAPFNNNSSGSINVQTGTLALKGGGTHAGTFTGSGGATLEFAGTHTVGTSVFNFGGQVKFFGGSTTFNVNYTANGTQFNGAATFNNPSSTSSFSFNSGTLTANNTFTVNGVGTWAGGTINGSGSFVAGGTAFLNFNGATAAMTVDTATITNGGFLNFSSPTNALSFVNGASITNNNIFDIQNDAPINSPSGGTFTNNGTMKKSAGVNTSIALPVTNAAGASLLMAMAGTLNFTGGYSQTTPGSKTQLLGGSLASPLTMNLNGGLLEGAGTISASLTNNATVSPGLAAATGGITVTGSYTQGATGILNIRLGGINAGAPANGYDLLAIGGTANFGGTLNVNTCCSFTPTNGQSFTPSTFANRTTDFGTKNLGTFGPGTSLTSNYTATSLQIQAVVSSDLNLLITDSPDPVNAGSNVVYTVKVTNNGPANITGSTVNLTLTGATIGSTSGFACSGTATTANCTGPALTSGNFATMTVTVTAPGSGPINLAGTVTSPNTDPNTTDNATSQSTVVTPRADLSLTKTGPGTIVAGGTVSYTITVVNNGPSDAATVQVTDATPAGLTFASNSGACTGPFPCALGTVTNGSTNVITSTYTVSPAASGSITNNASVSSTTSDPTPSNNSNNTTATVTQQADVAISKTGPASSTIGGNVVYTVVVTNNGPSNATGVVVGDPTPARLTFVSNSGACTTPYPCALGNLAPATSATITSTYTVTPGPNTVITNIASVTSAGSDPNTANNNASVNTAIGCPTVPGAPLPGDGATNIPLSGTFQWSNAGAASYKIYVGPAGSGCTTLFGTSPTNSLSYSGLNQGTQYEWRIEAVTPGCTTQTSSCFKFTTTATCPTAPPTLTAPLSGAATSSPITLTWTAVGGAIKYQIFASVGGAATTQISETTDTTFSADFSDGQVSWYVIAVFSNTCPPLQSATGSFNNCNVPPAPVPSVVATSTSNQSYVVQWDAIPGATNYEVDEANNNTFAGANTTSLTTTSKQYQHTVTTTTPFFYRVRAFGGCSQRFGPYSDTIRAVLIPIPPAGRNPNANVPVGSRILVVQQVVVPGFPGQTVQFQATVDKPWLSVTPSSGLLPPTGTTLSVTADPANLPNGTITGTVTVTFPGSGKTANDAPAPPVSLPVSISLVTPVSPVKNGTGPAANSLIIPSVGHLDGINSHWQSDVRVTNTGTTTAKYLLTFTPDDVAKGVKSTTITVDSGGTTALDDIINNWYGIGALGDSANGVLEIRPQSGSGKGIDANDVSIGTTTVASSRTYNVSNNGTLGQYIPAVPFANFIGKAASGSSPAPVLSLQQIAQSDAYRTNVGVVEAAGKSAGVLLTVFDPAGKRLLDYPISLKAGEQRQLNSFLALQNISLTDGRIEVKVLNGDGKVTAYASVVDNLTNDPLLVTGVPLSQPATDRFVVAGVADINNGLASWRTDMRVFNSGTIPQPVTLTFYPQNNSGDPASITVAVNAGEVKALDNILQSSFSLNNTGGAVHVTTPGDSTLIVSGRTYNQTGNGTYGQFIPAVTANDATGKGGRTLHILQVEDSVRYRTNVGIAEVTGKPARVELSVILPDSKSAPKIQIDLAPNEFQQIPLLKNLGLSNAYNARVTVKVIDGDGKVSAYGSVIDMTTQDPTYVSAQ